LTSITADVTINNNKIKKAFSTFSPRQLQYVRFFFFSHVCAFVTLWQIHASLPRGNGFPRTWIDCEYNTSYGYARTYKNLFCDPVTNVQIIIAASVNNGRPRVRVVLPFFSLLADLENVRTYEFTRKLRIRLRRKSVVNVKVRRSRRFSTEKDNNPTARRDCWRRKRVVHIVRFVRVWPVETFRPGTSKHGQRTFKTSNNWIVAIPVEQ